MFVADLYTGYLFLADLLNSFQGDYSIRVSRSRTCCTKLDFVL